MNDAAVFGFMVANPGDTALRSGTSKHPPEKAGDTEHDRENARRPRDPTAVRASHRGMPFDAERMGGGPLQSAGVHFVILEETIFP
jgi:hypothetical protein